MYVYVVFVKADESVVVGNTALESRKKDSVMLVLCEYILRLFTFFLLAWKYPVEQCIIN